MNSILAKFPYPIESKYNPYGFTFIDNQLAEIKLLNRTIFQSENGREADIISKGLAPYKIDQLRMLLVFQSKQFTDCEIYKDILEIFDRNIKEIQIELAKGDNKKKPEEIASDIFNNFCFTVDWTKYRYLTGEFKYGRNSLCNLQRRVEQEVAGEKYTRYSLGNFLDSLAQALVKGKEPEFNPLHSNNAERMRNAEYIAELLGPKENYRGLRQLQRAIEKLVVDQPVKVAFHPQWLRHRAGSDWRDPYPPTIPPCLQVTIGDQSPRMVTLWPKPPFLVFGYFPKNAVCETTYKPLGYLYDKHGKLTEIRFKAMHHSLGETWDSIETWHNVDQLHSTLAYLCNNGGCKEDVASDFKAFQTQLETSNADEGCVLKRTLDVFGDWEFTLNWKPLLKFGMRYVCGDQLCHFEFMAQNPDTTQLPFTVDEYMCIVAQALIDGKQPEIPKNRTSHEQIALANDELYRIIGPKPHEGLSLLNTRLKEIAGDGYNLEIDSEYAMWHKEELENWEPGGNHHRLKFTRPDGTSRLLRLDPQEPFIIWDRYHKRESPVDLSFRSVSTISDTQWDITITNYSPPSFSKDELLTFLKNHGFHYEADNLKYLYGKLANLYEMRKTQKLTYDEFKSKEYAIRSSWSCRFPIPDPDVTGLEKYVKLWRSKKSAEAAGKDWVRVDQDFWRERVFNCEAGKKFKSLNISYIKEIF